MVGLDTNILVRFIVRDDPRQAKIAGHRLREIRKAGDKGFISSVALVELAWVLASVYDYSRELIAEVIQRILLISHFKVENHDLVELALREYRVSKADFADCLVGQSGRKAGCSKTLTFDRKLKRLPEFEVL